MKDMQVKTLGVQDTNGNQLFNFKASVYLENKHALVHSSNTLQIHLNTDQFSPANVRDQFRRSIILGESR